MKELTILVDSRENTPWSFNPEEKKPGLPRIAGSKVIGLETGDYQIEGEPKLLCLERKAGFKEIFGNFSPVSNKERFEREMERMREFKYKYLIIETSLSKDILALSIPQFKYALPASKVFEWIYELQRKYNIIPIFAGDAGEKIAKSIIRKVVKENC